MSLLTLLGRHDDATIRLRRATRSEWEGLLGTAGLEVELVRIARKPA